METRDASVRYVRTDLLPEMVHDRRFCEDGSREFVEFVDAVVEPLDEKTHNCELYRSKVTINFSGEANEFRVMVKLLPEKASDGEFDSFQNEEMFYSKMLAKYEINDLVAKCYLSDLGKYGRATIVLEDLTEQGYARCEGKMDWDRVRSCLEALGKFHGQGLKLKRENYPAFREFYAKLHETSFRADLLERYERHRARITEPLKKLESDLAEKVGKLLGENGVNTAMRLATSVNDQSTICHGAFFPTNLRFGMHEDGKPRDVRVIDWQTMRYCSPSVDVGPALFAAFPIIGEPIDVERALKVYVEAVKREYPAITSEELEREIVSNLLYTYILLSLRGELGVNELADLLRLFDRLGAFDR